MDRINIKYQAALFLDATDIAPKPDTLTYFINEFSKKELIPGTFQEIGPTGVTERFNLKDSNGIWNIEFSSGRIDIIKTNANIGKTEIGTIEEFKNEVDNFLDVIFSKFPKKVHRLAFVTTHLIIGLDADGYSKVFNKIFNPIPTYKDNERSEWGARMVSRIENEFNKKKELHNVITEINRVSGNLNIESTVKNIERIQIKFDLNTFQGNNENRFDLDDMKSYFDEAVKWENKLREELNPIFE